MILHSTLVALLALGGSTDAVEDDGKQDDRKKDHPGKTAEELQETPDHGWISVTGTVASTMHEAFWLDFGEALVKVEMDDWDWYDEANQIVPGERVTVYGRLDSGVYELRTIEADSVYVFDRNSYYFASDADEEGDYLSFPYLMFAHSPHVADGTWMTVSGRVVKVDERELSLDTGFRKVRIDTAAMPYNPLDDVGFQRIDRGDRISVTGTLDIDFFEKDEIDAESIVTLNRDATKKRGESKPATADA